MTAFERRMVAYKTNPFGGVGIFYTERHNNEIFDSKLTLEKVDPLAMGHTRTPLIELGDGNAQELMDTLWQCGFRPSEGTGSAGALAATQNHLNDLRKICGAKLGVDL